MTYTLNEAREMLPQVGDILIRTRTSYNANGGYTHRRSSCVVDYVNRKHLWYRVKFPDGRTQRYKVPEAESYEGDQEV